MSKPENFTMISLKKHKLRSKQLDTLPFFCWVCLAWSHGRFITCVVLWHSHSFFPSWRNHPQGSPDYPSKMGKRWSNSNVYLNGFGAEPNRHTTFEGIEHNHIPVFWGSLKRKPVYRISKSKKNCLIFDIWLNHFFPLIDAKTDFIVRNRLNFFRVFFCKWFRSPRCLSQHCQNSWWPPIFACQIRSWVHRS